MNGLECPHGCGRKFLEQIKLDEHVQRRHLMQSKQFPSLYDNMKLQGMQRKILRPKLPQIDDPQQGIQSTTQHTFSQSLNQQLTQSVIQQLPPKPVQKIKLNQKSILRPSSSKQKIVEQQLQKEQISESQVYVKEKSQEKVVTIKEPPPIISTQELLEARKLITNQFICTNSDGSDLQSVTHLSLNDKNLLIFESTKEVPFSEFISLKGLSLSQNRLINIIGISELHNIIDLNINSNQITTLQPLNECKRLQKLYANYNLIQDIDLGLMIHLKIFQVGNNKLADLNMLIHSIQQMPSLKDLVIENNPCTQKYAYKYDIIWTVFLDKLDNKMVTQQDYNLAQAFKDTKQESKLSQSTHFSKLSRPQTAASSNQNMNEQSVDEDTAGNNVILESINKELEEEVEELYEINHNMREKIEKLENQNIEYRQIVERVPFLDEQLFDMKSKISAFETLLVFRDSPECELRKHIFNLTQELEQMKNNGSSTQYYEENNKLTEDQTKFQNTQTTFIQQLSQAESGDENAHSESDDDKYFRDDEDISQVPGQEIMELIMRNSMTLSKLKDEFKGMQ